MKKSKRILTVLFPVVLFLAALLISALAVPALAITESEVQDLVDANGKEAVTGNVLIWFLCAVAFLKVSQKIDSFMASLGVNVGHTGGSMLSDVFIVSRALSGAVKAAGHAFGGGGNSSATGSRSGAGAATSTNSFFQGGLAGMVSRAVNNIAVKTATENKAATNSVQSDVAREAVYSAAHSDSSSTIHSAAQGRSGTNGNNSGSMNTVGGMSTSVPGMENPIVRNGGDSNTVISTPGEVPAMPGDTSPLPSAIPASAPILFR